MLCGKDLGKLLSLRSAYASMLVAVGVTLFILNLAGIVIGPTDSSPRSTPERATIPGYHFSSRNPTDLQSMLAQKAPTFDLEVVNNVVFESLVHADDRRVQPHENWIMWLAGWVYEPASKTQNAWRIVSGGRAICSEAAAVVNEISKINGVDARFVVLNGHVVSEVRTDKGWQIADPDYGVVYSADLALLEAGGMSTVIKEKLKRRGFTDTTIASYIDFFESTEDNRVLEIGLPSSPRLHTFEQVAEWLKWILPGLMIITGLIVMREWRNRARI